MGTLALVAIVAAAGIASAQPAGALLPPGAPNPKGAAKKAVPPPPKPVDAPVSGIDPQTQLPIGFKPPAEIPDLMTLDKPLLSAPEIDALKKIEGKYKSAMRRHRSQRGRQRPAA